MPNRELTDVVSQIQIMAAGGFGPSDSELLTRFTTSGDEAAFELLVRRHERLVLGVCRRLLLDFRDVEDAFQAVFLALARKARSIAKREALAGWLYRVAYRSALTARVKWARDRRRAEPLDRASESVAPAFISEPAEYAESLAVIDDELHRLPQRLRIPAILCCLEGRTIDEAAREIGCPRGTVASRLARARARLRRRLIARGLTAPGAAIAAVLTTGEISTARSHASISSAARLAQWWTAADGPSQAAISDRAVALTREVLRAMSMKKLTSIAAFVIASAGFLLLGGTLGLRQLVGADEPARPVPQSRSEANPPAKEPPIEKKPVAAETDKRPTVTVMHPLQRDVSPYVDFSGRLEASRTVDVVARTDGRVETISCKVGAAVKRGDVLFEIDSAVAKENLAKARAQLDVAKVKFEASSKDYQRIESIAKLKGISMEEIERKKSQVEIERSAVGVSEVDVRRAQRELDATRVTAPIDGMVGRILVNDGGPVAANKTVLTAIQVLNPMQIVFEIDQTCYVAYQQALRDGKVKKEGGSLLVRVGEENEWKHQGAMTAFDDRFDRVRGTIRAEGLIANPGRDFVPGMFAKVRLILGPPRRVIVAPESSVMQFSGNYFVVVIRDNKLERLQVKINRKVDGHYVVEEGLNPDDWVVVSGGFALPAGQQVELRKLTEPQK